MGREQASGGKRRRRARRPSVVAYLLTAFAVCIASLVTITVLTSRAAYEREQRRVSSSLISAAASTASLWTSWPDQINDFLGPLATNAEIASLDPARCRTALAPLEILSAQGGVHLHVLRTDGTEVCRLGAPELKDEPYVAGDWLDDVLAGEQVEHLGLDPALDAPAATVAAPIVAGDRPIGVVAAVIATSTVPEEVPKGMPAQTVIVVTDPERSLVLSTSKSAERFVGTRLADGFPDLGSSALWRETKVDEIDWIVMAGIPKATATAPAWSELKRNLLLGAVSIAIVLLLGVLLHRRLARPVRRVGRAIEASLAGDDAARAPVDGPAEVAHVAEVFNDLIVERQAREAELEWQATHDPLTALPNRAAVSSHLAEALASDDADIAVLFLDLDRFKLVNDSHGHAVGDAVLVALGTRLAETMGDEGMVGRFGGDEFVAVGCDLGGKDGAVTMAGRLADALLAPLRVAGQEIWLSGSIGIALPRPGDTPDDLLRNADTAMYRAKENGRGGYALFDNAMRDWAILRLDLERDLHRAVERDELDLHYQPKVALGPGQPVGVEALLRWNHSERGPVSPAEFIPVAEETGLIVPIGAWVLRRATEEVARWRERTGISAPVAVNLSARQLSDRHLTETVAEALERAGALPQDLILEITESAVLQDADAASEQLRDVRKLGVRVAVDDFGTGYSSLSYLQRLPIDELKIDRSFVQRVDDHSTAAIVGSVVDLAHAIGLTVVAEGIETPKQLDVLRSLACDEGQGFLLARPQPWEATARFLLAQERKLRTPSPVS